MIFQEWIKKLKTDKPELSEFITKLEPLFLETGFNAAEFERKVEKGLAKVETDIENTVNTKTDAES